MYSTCKYTGYSNRPLSYWCVYSLAGSSFCVPPALYGNNRAVAGHLSPLVSLQGPYIHGVYAWELASPQYLCSVYRKWNLLHRLKVEMTCYDVSFNFNYIIVVMYGTSPETAGKQISHETRQHEKAS